MEHRMTVKYGLQVLLAMGVALLASTTPVNAAPGSITTTTTAISTTVAPSSTSTAHNSSTSKRCDPRAGECNTQTACIKDYYTGSYGGMCANHPGFSKLGSVTLTQCNYLCRNDANCTQFIFLAKSGVCQGVLGNRCDFIPIPDYTVTYSVLNCEGLETLPPSGGDVEDPAREEFSLAAIVAGCAVFVFFVITCLCVRCLCWSTIKRAWTQPPRVDHRYQAAAGSVNGDSNAPIISVVPTGGSVGTTSTTRDSTASSSNQQAKTIGGTGISQIQESDLGEPTLSGGLLQQEAVQAALAQQQRQATPRISSLHPHHPPQQQYLGSPRPAGVTGAPTTFIPSPRPYTGGSGIQQHHHRKGSGSPRGVPAHQAQQHQPAAYPMPTGGGGARDFYNTQQM